MIILDRLESSFFRVRVESVPFYLFIDICVLLLHWEFKERRRTPTRIGLLHDQFLVCLLRLVYAIEIGG